MKQKIAENDFEAFVGKNAEKFSARTIEMARLVLVHGHQQKTVAEAFGVGSSAVSQAIHRVMRAYNLTGVSEIPKGHQRITVVLPHEEARLVKALESAHIKRRKNAKHQDD